MSSDRYFQEYGPIRRRHGHGEPPDDDPPPRRPPPKRPPRRRRSTRRRSLWPALVPLLLLLVAAPFALPYALNLFYPDQALPGVSVQGMPMAGRSSAEIAAEIAARHDDFVRQPLTLVYRSQTWQPTLSDLGAQFDITGAAAAAVSAGRRGDPITRLRELWQLYQQGLEISPRVVIDLPTMQNYLLSLSPVIEQAPQDAALSIAAARIVGTPSTPGTQLLVDATANDILLAMQNLNSQEVSLRTRQLDPLIMIRHWSWPRAAPLNCCNRRLS